MRAKGVAGFVAVGILLGALASLLIHRLAQIGLSGVVAQPENTAAVTPTNQTVQPAVMPDEYDQRNLELAGEIDALRAEGDLQEQPIADLHATSEREPAASSLEKSPARVRDWSRWHDRENLIDAGYSVERTEYLLSRAEELAEQFRRSGNEQRDPAMDGGLVADRYFALKDEIGDAEYERFLAARKRPTIVGVAQVYPGFGAEAAGLRMGDEILLYDNMRVFNIGQLEGLSRQKKDLDQSGPPVPASVRRDGETILVMLPRGHLGFNAQQPTAPIITDRLPPPPDWADNRDNLGARQ